MTTTIRTTAAKPPVKGFPMSSTRKTALVAGVFYLITFISIPTLALYGPVKNHRDWILSSGSHTGVLVGALLEVIVALAGIGTAVTLYPVVKRQNEGVALGFVAARVLEASMIFAGVVSLLSLVTLRQGLGAAAGLPTEMATSLFTRCGWSDATSQATAAPQSWPTITAESTPRLLTRPTISPTRFRILYDSIASGRSVCP